MMRYVTMDRLGCVAIDKAAFRSVAVLSLQGKVEDQKVVF
jgi:hypothetical protein